MGKKLTPVELYYLEQHKDKLSPEVLAKRIGCTVRTIYNYYAKLKGGGRTEQERKELKGDAPVPAPDAPPPAPEPSTPPTAPMPPKGLHLIGRKKNGSSAAIAMTKEMSEVGDEIFKMGGGPNKNADYIFVMNPDRED